MSDSAARNLEQELNTKNTPRRSTTPKHGGTAARPSKSVKSTSTDPGPASGRITSYSWNTGNTRCREKLLDRMDRPVPDDRPDSGSLKTADPTKHIPKNLTGRTRTGYSATCGRTRRLMETREEMKIGSFHRRPCVRANWPYSNTPEQPEWIPVLGPEHTDAKIIKFPYKHLHVDHRFLRKDQKILTFPTRCANIAPLFTTVITTVTPDIGA